MRVAYIERAPGDFGLMVAGWSKPAWYVWTDSAWLHDCLRGPFDSKEDAERCARELPPLNEMGEHRSEGATR